MAPALLAGLAGTLAVGAQEAPPPVREAPVAKPRPTDPPPVIDDEPLPPRIKIEAPKAKPEVPPSDPLDDPPPPIPGKMTPKKPVDEEPSTPPVIRLPDAAPAKKMPVDNESLPTIRLPGAPKEEAPVTRTGPYVETVNRANEQAVVLEWIGPSSLKVGQPTGYQMIVRNQGTETVSGVIVRDRISNLVKVTKVEPEGEKVESGYEWNLGDLAPRQEKRITVSMVVEKKGEIACSASVTATTMSKATFKVTEPQLVVKQTGAETVSVGEPYTVTLQVSNPGDGPADNVVINAKLSDGLSHEKGKDFVYELGTLAAGETRNVHVIVSTDKGGPQQIMTVATADAGLEAKSDGKLVVTEPKLEVMPVGPKLRYLDRQATYAMTVTNPGTAPANNVRANAIIPAGFRFVDCSAGGRYDPATRTVTWFIGSIKEGEKTEVTYKCTALQPGNFKHQMTASAQRGLKQEAEVATAVEGIAALMLEVVDVDDPVENGSDTTYEVRVTNQGSREATDVEIHALVPKEMTIKTGEGPVKYRLEGQEVIFEKLPRLAPRADAVYRIHVKANGAGDLRFRVRMTSASLTDPVIEEESTKVYD
jgi:uncharacterized repeat protein (TIGR01451 family)